MSTDRRAGSVSPALQYRDNSTGTGETEERNSHVKYQLSTATVSVAFCVIVCTFFIVLSFQTRFDGDFMGGLVHSLLVIVITVMVLMSVLKPIQWPQLWYGGVSSYFLWFFHRMVVFPLIAVIFPFNIYRTHRVSNNE